MLIGLIIGALARLDPAWLLTAHSPLLAGEVGRDFLYCSALYTARLAGAVRTALTGRARSLRDILPEINPLAGDWPVAGTEGALAFPVVGHLEDLHQRGELRRFDTSPSTWELVDAG